MDEDEAAGSFVAGLIMLFGTLGAGFLLIFALGFVLAAI